MLALVLALAACGEASSDEVPADDAGGTADDGAVGQDAQPDSAPDVPTPLSFVAVTYNTGTTEGMGVDDPPPGGYSTAHALISDEWYGDGLAWLPAVDAAREFFAEVDPDVVVFQEIFYSALCADIPPEAREDFICETWQAGDPTVAQLILDNGNHDWQVMCHLGKDDKCAAVNRRFGSFRGCDEDFCLEGLDGAKVEGCGKGSRIGRGLIDLVAGGTLTLVNVHGTSGLTAEDAACRVKQVEQVFLDLGLGDGEPAANGARNLVMGDFNTDPGRLWPVDPSAARWNDFVGDDEAFHFITAVGEDARPTYAVANIDHVVSDALIGSCVHPGATEGTEPVIDVGYFDHKPAVCALETPTR